MFRSRSRATIALVGAIGMILTLSATHSGSRAVEPSTLAGSSWSHARLSVQSEGPARPIQRPSETDLRRTHESVPGAHPIPLLRGHLIAIRGEETVSKLGQAPAWDEVMAVLPEARRRYRAYQRRLELVRDGGGNTELSESAPAVAERMRVEECEETLMAFHLEGDVWSGTPLLGPENCRIEPMLSSLAWLRDRPGQPLVQANRASVVAFKPASPFPDSTLRADLWEAWDHSTTLLEMHRPLYTAEDRPLTRHLSEIERQAYWDRQEALEAALESALHKGSLEGSAAIRRALETDLAPRSRIWEEAARFAERQGELELALRVRSRFLPVGRCSMDPAPQLAARSYAELCFRMGDLGCFLNLQVRIMGDSFRRVAYSSYGEEAHETEAAGLWDVGIDVERFLRGLIVQFAVAERERIELDAWRLARSIREAGLSATMESVLSDLAFDEGVDPHNRLRATMILAYGFFQEQQPERFEKASHQRAWAQVLAKLSGMPLSGEARLWLESLASRIMQ